MDAAKQLTVKKCRVAFNDNDEPAVIVTDEMTHILDDDMEIDDAEALGGAIIKRKSSYEDDGGFKVEMTYE